MRQTEPGEALAQEGKIMKKVAAELAALAAMGLEPLRELYHELFGEETRSKNLLFLRKKLAFRIQERVEGGLSPRAQAQIEALAPEALPVKRTHRKQVKPKVEKPSSPSPSARPLDPRLPAVGALLVREHEGVAHEVEILAKGFLYRGRTYRSLSAIAKEVTGTTWNGFLFFALTARKATHGR
jgi:hypothetical protein